MSVWFITGVSTGLGRAFATSALQAGHTVVGTLRNAEQIADFEAIAPGHAHGRVLDVTHTDQIAPVVADIEATVGPIDVLINNAGYGVEGVFEETSLQTFRDQFEVNVFGLIAVTQAVLPAMRERRRGHIIAVTSMGGLRAFPGLAAYHGAKYAVEGIADTLRQELAPFGIAVTSVEPGGFRTDWAGRSMTRVERSIADYDELMEPVRANRLKMSGHQLGNPEKAGDALVELVSMAEPPGHLLLGSDAYRLVTTARAETAAEFEKNKSLTESTDFADGRTL